jgi:two-component system chemotaxis response regulator CheY
MTTKILVVDDSLMVRTQVKRALGAGFLIVEAVDGVDALEKLTAHPDTALIICDVNMPRMDGLDFLEKRALSPKLSSVPVVMLTTEGQQAMVLRARALGAMAWLLKPFKPEQLLAVAQKLAQAA